MLADVVGHGFGSSASPPLVPIAEQQAAGSTSVVRGVVAAIGDPGRRVRGGPVGATTGPADARAVTRSSRVAELERSPILEIGIDAVGRIGTIGEGSTMRKLSVGAFMTLDGVVQAPGGPGEDESGGFTLGGWSFHYWDDLMGEVMTASMSQPFDLVLGRRTYDVFAAFWPNASEEQGAKPLERRDQIRCVAWHTGSHVGSVRPDRG